MIKLPLFAALTLAACSAPSEPAAEPSPTPTASPTVASTEVSCTGPVVPGDTVETLKVRFGNDAQVQTLGGPEGLEFEGMALFPGDPARRLEVIFGDDASGPATAVRLRGETQWAAGGIQLGDGLSAVREANGAAFALWGFGWDYGGYVSELGKGRLASLPGGCSLSIRFDPDADLASEMLGEVTLSSDDPKVAEAGARVSELTLNFPAE